MIDLERVALALAVSACKPPYASDDAARWVSNAPEYWQGQARAVALDVIEQMISREHFAPFRRQMALHCMSDGTQRLEVTEIVRDALAVVKSELERDRP